MKKPEKKQIAAPPAAPDVSPEDLAFEAEILRRNPTRKPRDIARFDFPPEISEARAVYLFEMKAKDELAAAEMADATMTDVERKSAHRALEAERREAIRLSIVGLIVEDENTGALQRRHIDQSAPLMEIDDWSSKAWAALRTFFGDLNGIPVEELGKSVAGVRKLGAASTSPATRPGAAAATPSDG